MLHVKWKSKRVATKRIRHVWVTSAIVWRKYVYRILAVCSVHVTTNEDIFVCFSQESAINQAYKRHDSFTTAQHRRIQLPTTLPTKAGVHLDTSRENTRRFSAYACIFNQNHVLHTYLH